MSRFQRFISPWLWPNTLAQSSSWNHRLGRVFHWAFVVMALIAVLGGISLSAVTYRNHNNSVIEISDWKKSHSKITERSKYRPWENDPFVENSETSQPEFDPYAGLGVQNSDGDANLSVDSKPIEVSSEPEIGVFGLFIGIVLLLIGRATRYVLAAE